MRFTQIDSNRILKIPRDIKTRMEKDEGKEHFSPVIGPVAVDINLSLGGGSAAAKFEAMVKRGNTGGGLYDPKWQE